MQRDLGSRLICLKGNHEDIMWQTCRKLPSPSWWLSNGGGATLISYGQKKGDQADVSVVPAAHLDWIEKLPLMHVDKWIRAIAPTTTPATHRSRNAPVFAISKSRSQP